MKTLFVLFASVLVLSLSSFTSAHKPTKWDRLNPSLQRKITPLMNQLQTALREGNPQKAAELYAEDATLLGPEGQKIKGRKAIEQEIAGWQKGADWSFKTQEVDGEGEFIYQIGQGTRLTAQGAPETYDFVILWKKQADWSYKIYMNSYN